MIKLIENCYESRYFTWDNYYIDTNNYDELIDVGFLDRMMKDSSHKRIFPYFDSIIMKDNRFSSLLINFYTIQINNGDTYLQSSLEYFLSNQQLVW